MKWCCWGHWGHRYSKAWKITTGHSRVIQVVEFGFILMIWKILFFVKSWNIIFNFLHLFCWRLLRPGYIIFVKIGSNNQNVHISEFQNYLQIYIIYFFLSEPNLKNHFALGHPVDTTFLNYPNSRFWKEVQVNFQS